MKHEHTLAQLEAFRPTPAAEAALRAEYEQILSLRHLDNTKTTNLWGHIIYSADAIQYGWESLLLQATLRNAAAPVLDESPQGAVNCACCHKCGLVLPLSDTHLWSMFGTGAPVCQKCRAEPCVTKKSAEDYARHCEKLAEADKVLGISAVDHPAHYGGADNPYEAIKVIEAWGLGFNLGNTVKYVSRAGKKGDYLEDLKKARWYLDREIAGAENTERNQEHPVDALVEDMKAIPHEVVECPIRGFFRDGRFWQVNPAYTSLDPEERKDPQSLLEDAFVSTFNELAAQLNANSRDKGFWDARDFLLNITGAHAVASAAACDTQAMGLIGSEVGEAVESIRAGHPADKNCPDFTNTEVELADAIVRIAEYAHGRGWRVAQALIAKMRYNRTRARLHGKNS